MSMQSSIVNLLNAWLYEIYISDTKIDNSSNVDRIK